MRLLFFVSFLTAFILHTLAYSDLYDLYPRDAVPGADLDFERYGDILAALRRRYLLTLEDTYDSKLAFVPRSSRSPNRSPSRSPNRSPTRLPGGMNTEEPPSSSQQPRSISLLKYAALRGRRGHFGIFVPSAADPAEGTVIHIVGAPMSGYSLEFKRKYNPSASRTRSTAYPLGEVRASGVADFTGPRGQDTTPIDELERVADKVPPPKKAANFLAPSPDCQDWTVEFLEAAARAGLVSQNAASIAKEHQDVNQGLRLKPVGGSGTEGVGGSSGSSGLHSSSGVHGSSGVYGSSGTHGSRRNSGGHGAAAA